MIYCLSYISSYTFLAQPSQHRDAVARKAAPLAPLNMDLGTTTKSKAPKEMPVQKTTTKINSKGTANTTKKTAVKKAKKTKKLSDHAKVPKKKPKKVPTKKVSCA